MRAPPCSGGGGDPWMEEGGGVYRIPRIPHFAIPRNRRHIGFWVTPTRNMPAAMDLVVDRTLRPPLGPQTGYGSVHTSILLDADVVKKGLGFRVEGLGLRG
jgi:hypothetical protein